MSNVNRDFNVVFLVVEHLLDNLNCTEFVYFCVIIFTCSFLPSF